MAQVAYIHLSAAPPAEMNASMEPEMNDAGATTMFNRRTNGTASSTSKNTTSISLEGQDFDISNLLSSLPTDGAAKNSPTISSKDEKPAKRRINTRSSLVDVSYPAVSSKHSVHHVRPSFLASTNALAGFVPEPAPHEPVQRNTGASEDHPRRGSNITSISRLSMMSNISALSDSFAFEDGHFMADEHYTTGATDIPPELPSSVASFFAASNDLTEPEHQLLLSLSGDDTESQNRKQEIEVAPDVYLPFRSSEETWNAIKSGQSSDLTCVHCSLGQVVANDCTHVICPECHTINQNPATQNNGGAALTDVHPILGVSMGFRNEWCGGY